MSQQAEWEIATLIRLTLTCVLLCLVWSNSHWSVALAISGLSLNNEVLTHLVKR